MDNQKKQPSHSMYAYTALIFIVAIVMIILAFFGQSNLDKNQDIHSEGKSITEKSAALSNENLLLRDKIADLEENIEQQEGKIAAQDEVNNISSNLIAAQLKIEKGDIEGAKQIVDSINEESLTGDFLEIYQILKVKTMAANTVQP